MAGGVQCSHLYALAYCEGRVVGWGLGDLVAVPATDDGQFILLKELCVPSSVIVVVMSIDDLSQLDLSTICPLFENRQDSEWNQLIADLLSSLIITYSGGFAGSIMTASLVFESVTM